MFHMLLKARKGIKNNLKKQKNSVLFRKKRFFLILCLKDMQKSIKIAQILHSKHGKRKKHAACLEEYLSSVDGRYL